ncbi:polysaccharide biosynthesis/export family protein [Paludibacter sp. 221]|uniref:polysaccharide biosynthesis/export family protein n=1 Tax=Paludibacter sp. 221 TaxID=2302939 RepID=UPI0013D5FD44|nr:polysaccharide biosynthesis/export family protein [Paludibacter sp. 221]
MQEKNTLLPKYENVEYEDYRIQVDDELVYRLITSDETISSVITPSETSYNNMISYRVSSDGTVSLPFIKNISVEGLTVKGAAIIIEKRFREIIPDATIKLTLQNRTFTVTGELGAGVYPIYKEKLTIYQALALTGDINNAGDRKHVRILREQGAGKAPLILEFDIRPESIIDSEYYYIYPNDVIYVQRSGKSFFNVTNYSTFVSLITSSVNVILTALTYSKVFK